MSTSEDTREDQPQFPLPSVEEVQKELGKAKSMDDFFGKEGIFAELFARTLEEMLKAELTEKLGYEPYAVQGRNSGNSRNGHYAKKDSHIEWGNQLARPPRPKR